MAPAENYIGYCGTVGPYDNLTGSNLEGGKLFRQNCLTCHTMDKELTGPALYGAFDRAPSKTFIQELLLKPKQTVRKYSYAAALAKKYRHKMHYSFAGTLTEKDVDDIVAFLAPGY